ncbi:hypothetical protein K470DRAFT_254401 [Piedraia hortae CBS 480.64]|uniref:Uncharacterized protein n=1 Tax=Piedraia hortae CBS 480.64 TaxID=1314780 RepID=A0A6A7C972_9PEZI|nr:hypothetical protein K470DRAFT_254401 [Piedraia hortae CBS 480.64]
MGSLATGSKYSRMNNSQEVMGPLTYQRALDIARNTEDDLDKYVLDYLEKALVDIWQRIQDSPHEYVLTRDEFAIFNFFRPRFANSSEAELAVCRYWDHAQGGESADGGH